MSYLDILGLRWCVNYSDVSFDVDVVVVGAGPIGLVLSNYLGKFGIKTLLVEKNDSTVSEPRAVSIDDESLRAIQGINLADTVTGSLMPDYGSCYQSPAGDIFARVSPDTREYGYPRRNGVHQDVLEKQLKSGLQQYSNVETWFGHQLISFSEVEDGVELMLKSSDGEEKSVKCRYLCASDGASSFIRKTLGVVMEGATYGENWLIIDIENTKDLFRDTRVYCNPSRPGISLPGPNGTRRFEFMLLKGETNEEVLAETNVRKLLRDHGPDEHAIIRRKTVYTFHARVAKDWKHGRVALLGDAAHLTPPFAGQGMNSGVRDSHNYAWKLAQVILGRLGPKILDTYPQERKPHAQSLVDMAIKMGHVMMPLSKTAAFCTRIFFKSLAIYPPAQSYITQMKYKPKPRFSDGFFVPDGHKLRNTIVGRMFIQPMVESNKTPTQKKLLDNYLSDGFTLLSYAREPNILLKKINGKFVEVLKVESVCITPKSVLLSTDVNLHSHLRDINGDIEKILKSYGECVLLLRPDRYVAAVFTPVSVERVNREVDTLVEATW